MSKPVVGVFSLWDEEKKSLWMLPDYLHALKNAGAIPMIFPLNIDRDEAVQLAGHCDGFLFTGGNDVDPSFYGEEKTELCQALCEDRDRVESAVFRYAYRENKPILGVCRGMQLINALMGGTLYQDLVTQYPNIGDHRMKPPHDQVWHTVETAEGGLLEQWFGHKTLGVNSCHHQGVHALGAGLRVEAVAPDGLVEAVSCPQHRFLLALQWHPEMNYHTAPESPVLFEKFAAACRG